MSGFFADGSVVDLILVLMLLEGAALVAYRWRTGRGLAIASVLAMLLAGAFLLLALRAALTGAAWNEIAICLLAALAAHLFDLGRRFRG